MRYVLTILAILIGSFGLSWQDAVAAPLPSIAAPTVTTRLIETVDYWKRYWRRRGYSLDVVVPDAQVNIDVDAGVTVRGETPPVIAIVPVRPVSCGEYRYWDGERCVDARYNSPYLGPR
jgi:hypothetical protein